MQIVTYKSIANADQKIKGIHGSTSYRLFFFNSLKTFTCKILTNMFKPAISYHFYVCLIISYQRAF